MRSGQGKLRSLGVTTARCITYLHQQNAGGRANAAVGDQATVAVVSVASLDEA